MKPWERQHNIVWLYTLKCFHEPQGLALIASVFSGWSVGNVEELSHILALDKTLKNAHKHSYAPAFYPHEALPLAKASQTMSFNSLSQWDSYAETLASWTSLGLRINPKLQLKQPSYCDSSHAQSRFGVDTQKFQEAYQQNPTRFKVLQGLHFHAFCHQETPALAQLFAHILLHYTWLLPSLQWLNLGGGQNFTADDYDSIMFHETIEDFEIQYPHITLYFEPASSVVENTGYFRCSILDIIDADIPKVILNTSIETHLLDVAITQRTLEVRGTSSTPTAYTYELTGMSCIAGDSLGVYHFDSPLEQGDTLIFDNMIGYTLVKQTTFNGIQKAPFILA
ncbi:MAG: hypothetical protein Q9M36_12390 [Sulfurovum sp.]|nr:hypothetical protein [Sulfurovum sp.]